MIKDQRDRPKILNFGRLIINSNPDPDRKKEKRNRMSKGRSERKDLLTDEYFRLQLEYEKKYGQAIVMMQVGKFYEMYQYNPSESDTSEKEKEKEKDEKFGEDDVDEIGIALELSEILNLKVASRNGNKPHSRENPYFIGFPTVAYLKHRDTLLSHGYTVIRVDQTGSPLIDPSGRSSAPSGLTVPSTKGTGKIKGKTGKTGKAGTVERKVGDIASPGTTLDTSLPLTNYITCLYIEFQPSGKEKSQMRNSVIICGLSCLDVTTGKSLISEVYTKLTDNNYVIQEIYRFIVTHSPRELLIQLAGIPDEQIDEYKRYLREVLELDRYSSIIRANDVNSEYLKVNYQEQFLSKLFPRKGKNGRGGSIEDLNLERLNYGTISYILLLQFCYEHNETIIQKLQRPETSWTDEDKYLVLTYNAILQLDLMPPPTSGSQTRERGHKKTYDSLFSLYAGNATTILGKRHLKSLLLNPITDAMKLNHYYDMTDEMLRCNLDSDLEPLLKKIPDLERYHRKLALGIIKPHEFSILFYGYGAVLEILQLLNGRNLATLNQLPEQEFKDFVSCLHFVTMQIQFDSLSKAEINKGEIITSAENLTFIKAELDPIHDALIQKIRTSEALLKKICDHLNIFLTGTRGKLLEFQLESLLGTSGSGLGNGNKDPEGPEGPEDQEDPEGLIPEGSILTALVTTEHKAKVLYKNKHLIDLNLCGQIEFKNIKKKTYIVSDVILSTIGDLTENIRKLQRYLFKVYKGIIVELNSKFHFYTSIVKFIELLDFIKLNAKTARRYKYHRPIISNVENDQIQKLEIKDLRHPIIERLIPGEYITNDITVGSDNNGNDNVATEKVGPNGMIVFALNGCGKSSMIKAVALVLIAAQAGLFVSGKLTFTPYSRIITRLSGHDNLFTGDSSFSIEMKELKSILKNANRKSLVVIDELCRGTENISGSSLAIAAIETLVERGVSFLMSTHLHNIVSTSYISNIAPEKLRICHLSTTYDQVNDILVYDRKLKDGSGSSIYGIEIARSLNLDSDFLDRADKIRRDLSGLSNEILSTKKSRYNQAVYIDTCEICDSKVELETHHLKEQTLADQNGFIDHYHKNSVGNLIILCQTCHTWLHKNKLRLKAKESPSGRVITLEN